MRIVPCRSCAAPIAFIETPRGNYVPVDPELVMDFVTDESGPPRVTLVGENGELLTGKQASLTTPGSYRIEGYLSHFATCTNPGKHRKRVRTT